MRIAMILILAFASMLPGCANTLVIAQRNLEPYNVQATGALTGNVAVNSKYIAIHGDVDATVAFRGPGGALLWSESFAGMLDHRAWRITIHPGTGTPRVTVSSVPWDEAAASLGLPPAATP